MSRLSPVLVLAIALVFAADRFASGQMVATQSPFQTNSSSFYEQSNVNWGIHNPHYFMEFNGGGVTPPFGGFQPNAGLHTGFAVGNAHFDLGFAQGASINSTMAAPVLTTTNGVPGAIFFGSSQPFVTGIAPQVGTAGFFSVPPSVDPLTARMAAGEFRIENRRVVSGVQPPAIPGRVVVQPEVETVAPSRRDHSEPAVNSYENTAAQIFERAEAAQKAGKSGMARIYYQLAATKGDAIVKARASAKLEELKVTAGAK